MNRIDFWDYLLIVKHGECSKGAVSGKLSWPILPNDKPDVDSIINNYDLKNHKKPQQYIESIARGLKQMHSAFVLGILKHLNVMYLNIY